MLLLLTPLLFGLSFLSGMLGLGVAFIAIPVLGLFGYDLINVIQPWALLLNGLTAISAAIAFWRKGMVDKRGALILVTITAIGAPLGVWLVQFASPDLVWWIYVGVLLFLAVRMAMPKGASTEVVTSIASVIGAWLGARFTAGRVKSATLSRIFAVALVALAVQRAWILLS
jgi:uncharacterized membrane protein YfcA